MDYGELVPTDFYDEEEEQEGEPAK
jgi:hypothetical protein